jgi:osmotically-inducible protein OsmY
VKWPCAAWINQFSIAPAVLMAYVGIIGCHVQQQQADDQLASRIDEVLLTSDELNLSRIEVNVEDGTVYLSGMSDDHESKEHAEKEARLLAGDKRIINKIEVDF